MEWVNESGDGNNCSVLPRVVDANVDESLPAASQEQTEESVPSDNHDNCLSVENAKTPSTSCSPEEDDDLVLQSVKIGRRSKRLTVKLEPDINTGDSNLAPETPNTDSRQYADHTPPLGYSRMQCLKLHKFY